MKYYDSNMKVTDDHLKRDAFLYIRQATLKQVPGKTENIMQQYVLRERAAALGWPVERIKVIDSDLGCSGALNSDRLGFSKLIFIDRPP